MEQATIFDFCKPQDQYHEIIYKIEKLQNSYDMLRKGLFSRYTDLKEEVEKIKKEISN